MKRLLAVSCAALFLVVSAAACVPRFPEGAELTATADDPYVILEWTAAEEIDADQEIVEYRIDIDGVEVVRVADWATSCVLSGLAPDTTYEIALTAYDTAGEWSEAGGQRLTTTYTTGPVADGEPELGCSTAPPPPIG